MWGLFAWRSGRRDDDAAPPDPVRAPDIRLGDLQPHGGGSNYVDFSFTIANYGTQRCEAALRALVGEHEVTCQPATVELLPDQPKTQVRVLIPRPSLGTLIQ